MKPQTVREQLIFELGRLHERMSSQTETLKIIELLDKLGLSMPEKGTHKQTTGQRGDANGDGILK